MNDKSPTIGTFATVLEAQKRLREISGDSRFTNEDRKEIAKRISELKKKEKNLASAKAGMGLKAGGLAEATAKLKAKGFKEGGMVVKDKTVAIDKSPNSGLITTKGFRAGRRT